MAQVDRQTVPDSGRTDGECPSAENGARSRNVQFMAGRRPKMLPAGPRGDRDAVLSQLGRCQPVQAPVNEHGYFVRDTVAHGQPVQTTQHWRDMIESLGARDQSCGGVLNALEPRHESLADTPEQAVTVVDAAADKCVYQCLCCVDRNRRSDCSELAQLEKT